MIIGLIAFLVVLLLCSAFFSSAETALFSLNSLQVQRIRERRPPTGSVVESLLSAPTKLLSTILIGNTLVNITASGVGYMVASKIAPERATAISISSMTLLLLVFGEVAPKRLAMAKPEGLAAAYARSLMVLIRILKPVRVMLEVISHVFKEELYPGRTPLTEDEFLTVVEVGEEEGVLDEEERDMVDGIIRLEETQVSDIMTPRVDLVGIDLEDPLEEAQEKAKEARFRYLPVYRESLDNAEGLLDVPRFLLSGGKDLKGVIIPPFFVPETVPLDTLLLTFQRENRRVAYVVDEFGGTAGLVTRGDILEEIVDDVDGEYGSERPPIQQIGPNRWLVDGSTSLEDVNYELDAELSAEGADRIAGWVTAKAERIPRIGEVISAQGFRVKIERRRKNRIMLVTLERVEVEEAHAD